MTTTAVRILVKKSFARNAGCPFSIDGIIERETARAILVKGHATTERGVMCAVCGRDLTAGVSRLIGVGPICCEKYGIARPSESYFAGAEKIAAKAENGASLTAAEQAVYDDLLKLRALVREHTFTGWIPKSCADVSPLAVSDAPADVQDDVADAVLAEYNASRTAPVKAAAPVARSAEGDAMDDMLACYAAFKMARGDTAARLSKELVRLMGAAGGTPMVAGCAAPRDPDYTPPAVSLTLAGSCIVVTGADTVPAGAKLAPTAPADALPNALYFARTIGNAFRLINAYPQAVTDSEIYRAAAAYQKQAQTVLA